MWKNLKFGAKIGVGFALVLLFTAGVGIIGRLGLESFLSAFHRSETAGSLNDKMNGARLE